MDAYSIFKFLHVICAIAWVGGGLTLLANSIIAERAGGEMETLKTLDIMNNLGKTWFVPASMLTVVFGVIAAVLGGSWLDFWAILGLAGFASTFFTGLLFIEPTGRKIGAAVADGRIDDALVEGRHLLRIVRFDYTVMLVVIADMVIKPGPADLIVIGLMVLAIAAGAYAFLLSGKVAAPAQAA